MTCQGFAVLVFVVFGFWPVGAQFRVWFPQVYPKAETVFGFCRGRILPWFPVLQLYPKACFSVL